MRAIIMRGISGAGKSSYVNSLKGNKFVCSADFGHMVRGVYRFDPMKLEQAHLDCFTGWMKWILMFRDGYRGLDFLVCDNTNLTAAEIAPYWQTANWAGIKPEIVRIEVDPYKAAARNLHSVPMGKVLDMYQTLRNERLPPHFAKTETVILADSFKLEDE